MHLLQDDDRFIPDPFLLTCVLLPNIFTLRNVRLRSIIFKYPTIMQITSDCYAGSNQQLSGRRSDYIVWGCTARPSEAAALHSVSRPTVRIK